MRPVLDKVPLILIKAHLWPRCGLTGKIKCVHGAYTYCPQGYTARTSMDKSRKKELLGGGAGNRIIVKLIC